MGYACLLVWGVLIWAFTIESVSVNFLILLALLYENSYYIVAVLTRKKNFASMKKCENVMLLFSHTDVIVTTGMGSQKLRFLKSKKQQTSPVCSHQPLPESTSNSNSWISPLLGCQVSVELIAIKNVLTIVKLPRVDVIVTLCVQCQLIWNLSVRSEYTLTPPLSYQLITPVLLT